MAMVSTKKTKLILLLKALLQTASLLFMYQSSWMKCLLRTYGNEICLLDAARTTTRYALQLFFMVVKTNVDYEVVGAFVCEGGKLKILCQH